MLLVSSLEHAPHVVTAHRPLRSLSLLSPAQTEAFAPDWLPQERVILRFNDVVAPADGTIATIQHDADDAIYVTASSVHTYYVGHMLAASGLAVGQKITAGQRLGTTSPVSHALDLGVLNSTVTNAFVNPGCDEMTRTA